MAYRYDKSIVFMKMEISSLKREKEKHLWRIKRINEDVSYLENELKTYADNEETCVDYEKKEIDG